MLSAVLILIGVGVGILGGRKWERDNVMFVHHMDDVVEAVESAKKGGRKELAFGNRGEIISKKVMN